MAQQLLCLVSHTLVGGGACTRSSFILSRESRTLGTGFKGSNHEWARQESLLSSLFHLLKPIGMYVDEKGSLKDWYMEALDKNFWDACIAYMRDQSNPRPIPPNRFRYEPPRSPPEPPASTTTTNSSSSNSDNSDAGTGDKVTVQPVTEVPTTPPTLMNPTPTWIKNVPALYSISTENCLGPQSYHRTERKH